MNLTEVKQNYIKPVPTVDTDKLKAEIETLQVRNLPHESAVLKGLEACLQKNLLEGPIDRLYPFELDMSFMTATMQQQSLLVPAFGLLGPNGSTCSIEVAVHPQTKGIRVLSQPLALASLVDPQVIEGMKALLGQKTSDGKCIGSVKIELEHNATLPDQHVETIKAAEKHFGGLLYLVLEAGSWKVSTQEMPEPVKETIVEAKPISASSLLANLTNGFGKGVKSVPDTAGTVLGGIAYSISQIRIDPILLGRVGGSWRKVVDWDLTEAELRVVEEFLS